MSDDDAARLVEADALLARGELRGELIVVQCALARGGFSRERGIALRKRELELLLAHENEWANLDGLARNWTFRRGFVDEITVDVARFVTNEEEIFRRAPYLRWVHFTAAQAWEAFRDLLERALASGRIRYVSAPFPDDMARWLTSQPEPLGRLRGLALRHAALVDVATFARTPWSSGLEELELEGDLFSAPSLAQPHYVASTLQPRRLCLFDTRPSSRSDERGAAMEALLATPVAARLTELESSLVVPILARASAGPLRSLRVNGLYDRETLERLTGCEHLDRLEHLAVDGGYGPAHELDIEPLLRPKRLPSLRTLRLGTGLTPARARRLLASTFAEQLEEIDLRHSRDLLEPHREALRRVWDGHLLL